MRDILIDYGIELFAIGVMCFTVWYFRNIIEVFLP